jgi:hypothetical protein
VRLPRGAREIVEVRQRGEKPDMPVIVSCVGEVRGYGNPVVRLDPPADEWGFLADLDVVVFVSANTIGLQSSTLVALGREARTLDLWDVDKRAGVALVPRWRHPVHNEFGWDVEVRRAARFSHWLKTHWAAADNARWSA